ncbi:Flp pilus assembly protein CpaB [Oceanirhabdus sp. W0125-5]|uniref:Flp pilus assembly protein CpaB n=1 Tax=Oceanirhabdus sp. W0125-5 TaxID=2999116 RepID=UPI0022F2D421|nr:RcpC/CpaB family pilus assembly protein [Oceanirhabdus sp. W0125-5]WBW95958.1 RcpC/CpaB family pilus assembly protein [Oceanirhabdus sp. W0125-5]
MYKNITIRVLVAVVVAIMASVLTLNYLKDKKGEMAIIVANGNIESGSKITEKNVKEIKVNKDVMKLYPKVITKKEEVIGAIASVRLEDGQPIEKKPNILVYGQRKTLALNSEGKVNDSYFIPEGMRVVGIKVDGIGGLNYSLKKEDFVDVIYTSIDESTGGLYSRILLQHMEIFDIQNIDVDVDGKVNREQRVLLLATPEEAVQLTVGNRNGILDLALNPLKGRTQNVKPVHILSYAARPPETFDQMLKNLERYIKSKEVTPYTKEKLLKALEGERDIQMIIKIIEASEITTDQKEKLLNLLR